VSAAPAPRLTSGLIASLLFHGALIAGLFALRPTAEPMQPPMYRVQLIAAPAGDMAAGVVQEKPPAPPVEKPAPVTPPPAEQPTTTKETVPAKKKPPTAKPVAKRATPSPRAATPPPKKAAAKADQPQPTAGGGPTGGKGTDVANVDTPGIDFPYPAYTTNIVSQLIRRFGPMQGTLTATVRFVIRRDGSVDPESIKMVTHSGSYPFDLRAYGAVESAANAKAFGPLPPGFNEDILPVTFRFSPSIIR
jgi:outer membrane biosynthesis protein TonB